MKWLDNKIDKIFYKLFSKFQIHYIANSFGDRIEIDVYINYKHKSIFYNNLTFRIHSHVLVLNAINIDVLRSSSIKYELTEEEICKDI